MSQAAKVPVVAPRSAKDIERIALGLIMRTYPDLMERPGPFPIIEFIEFRMRDLLGFNYSIAQLPRGLEATTNPTERLITIGEETYCAGCDDDGRSRFTLCDEVGHAIIHADLAQPQLSSGRGVTHLNRGQIRAFRDPEWQANTFAGNLLMPQHHVRELMKDGATAGDLMDIFEVSYGAATVRINKLSARNG